MAPATSAIRSKSSLYFERYGRAESENIRLHFIVYLLGAVCAVLVVGMVAITLKPQPVHYVPGAASRGVSYAGKVPESSAVSFASAWILDWMNYTPETANGVYGRAVKFMAPGFLSEVRSRMEEELARIKRDRLSSVFALQREPEFKETPSGFEVSFQGERVIFMGKEALSTQRLRCVLIADKAAPTDVNPYALVVRAVTKEEVVHEDR
jgi:hypothetical protein